MQKHTENYDGHKVRALDVLSFFNGVSIALVLYVSSFYFQEASRQSAINAFYLLTYASVFVALLSAHKVVRRFGASLFFFFLVLLQIIVTTLLVFADVSLTGAALLMAHLFLSSILLVALDVLLESFSTDARAGRIRGSFLSFLSLGILCGPLVSTQLLERFGFGGIFTLLIVLYAIMLVFGLVQLRRTVTGYAQQYVGDGIFAAARSAFGRKDIRTIYGVAFVLEFFYALMNIYVPLHLLVQGFSWTQIGFAFTVMLVPFVFVQYPAGFLADKKWGEKEMLIVAFLLMMVSTAMMFFLEGNDIVPWVVLLVVGRIGAAIVEIMRDAFFYRHVDRGDVPLISFFRTTHAAGFVVGACFSAALFFFFPLSSVFFLVTAMLLFGLIAAFFLRDSVVATAHADFSGIIKT